MSPTAPPDLERHAEAIDRDGYTILERVVEADLVDALVARIDQLLDELAVPVGANSFLGQRTRRLFNLLARDELFARVPLHPGVLALVERVLDPQCLLSSLTGIEMGPGQQAQPLHADDGSVPLPRPHVPLACVAIWALTDFTVDNGATRLVPGSHRYDRRPAKGERVPTVAAAMPRGSVLVYHGSMWHGGGDNASGDRRMGVVANYCAGFMRQEENQLLGVPRTLVARFPRRLQEMVGYGTYRGLIGHVDQRDPGELLDPEVSTRMIWDAFD